MSLMRVGRIAFASPLVVTQAGLGTISSVFSTEKTRLRCSILHASEAVHLLYRT